jgi:hypothetical protein
MNNLLVEVLGDIPVDHLTHQHGRKFISTLQVPQGIIGIETCQTH